MARRRSRGKSRSKGRGGRKRTATKRPTKRRVQRSRQTTITIKRGHPERTTIYEEYYEEEW